MVEMGPWRLGALPRGELPGWMGHAFATATHAGGELRGRVGVYGLSGRPEDGKPVAPARLEAAAWGGDLDLRQLSGCAGDAGWYVYALESDPGAPLVTLEERVRREGPLAAPEGARIALRLAEALLRARKAGGPASFSSPARLVEATRTGALGLLFDYLRTPHWPRRRQELSGALVPPAIGSPRFAAPESLRGPPRAEVREVYEVGACLCWCLTGRPPLAGEGQGGVRAIVQALQDPAPRLGELRPDLDPRLAALGDGCLVRDPALRMPRSVEALATELARFAGGARGA